MKIQKLKYTEGQFIYLRRRGEDHQHSKRWASDCQTTVTKSLGVPGVSQGQERSQLCWSLWMAGDWDEKTREMGDLTKSWGSYGGWALLCACQETICHSTISIAVKKMVEGIFIWLIPPDHSLSLKKSGQELRSLQRQKLRGKLLLAFAPCLVQFVFYNPGPSA